MLNHFRICNRAAVLLASAVILFSGPVFGQFLPTTKPQAIDEAKKKVTPRTTDGHPDLTGNWIGPGGGADLVHGAPTVSPDGGTITLQLNSPETQTKVDAILTAHREQVEAANTPPYKPELAAKVQSLGNDPARNDPTFRCLPLGVPRMGAPSEIIESAGVVALLYSNRNVYRLVPTDGRPHDNNAESMPDGNAVAHWDGDTLVVDVMNLTDDTWMGDPGYFHSSAMHVVERFTRQGNTLSYAVTVDDPEVLTKPWVLTPRVLLLGRPGEHVGEDYPCVEKDQSHLVNSNHHYTDRK